MTATNPETSNTTTLIKPAIKWGALVFFIVTFCIVLALPQSTVIPVEGATTNDWNHKTFWYEPWGSSGTHKGIDIFGVKGTPLVAATGGVVIFSGELSKGGTVVAVLGPKWRVHYYAHMDSAKTFFGDWVSQGEVIGALGDSGNAAGKAPHLHYSILTLVPYPWRWDASTQGWKKMFYLDPGKILAP